MVSSFKEKLKTKTSKAQNKCIHFWLNLPPRSHINPSHFRKIKWFPVSDRVEYCIANTVFKYWNIIVPGYVNKCLNLHFADIAQDHRYPSDGPKSALVSKMLEHGIFYQCY